MLREGAACAWGAGWSPRGAAQLEPHEPARGGGGGWRRGAWVLSALLLCRGLGASLG